MEADFLQRNWHWALLAVTAATFLVVDFIRSVGDKTSLNAHGATMLINREDAVVIDVREQTEYALGHIPNARHIPLGELDRRLPELEQFKSTPVILCCATGVRSRGATAKLKQAGFEKVFNLKGGVTDWSKGGQPLTTGRKPKGKKAAA